MELGKIGLWASFDGLEMSHAVETAQRIEALGYSALWHPMSMQRDLMLVASQLLANTERLIVATGIMPIFERQACVLSAGQSFLDEQSGGRFLLGLGVSHQPIVEGMHSAVYGPPLTSMREYLDKMDRGLDFSALLGVPRESEEDSARPVQSGPPRVLAALGPKMLTLSRDRAQGAHPYFMPPEHTRDAREILGPEAWLCPEVKVVLETNPSRARAAARVAGGPNIALENYRKNWRSYDFNDADFADGGSDRLIDATVAWGTQAKVEEFLQAHFDAGATQVCIQVVQPDPDATELHWEAIEALGERFGL
jgi:probable F420-dependent oxidoreductase